MTDIVERLDSLYDAGMFEASPVIREAADEIKRLRGRVLLLEGLFNGSFNVVRQLVVVDTSRARAALEGK